MHFHFMGIVAPVIHCRRLTFPHWLFGRWRDVTVARSHSGIVLRSLAVTPDSALSLTLLLMAFVSAEEQHL